MPDQKPAGNRKALLRTVRGPGDAQGGKKKKNPGGCGQAERLEEVPGDAADTGAEFWRRGSARGADLQEGSKAGPGGGAIRHPELPGPAEGSVPETEMDLKIYHHLRDRGERSGPLAHDPEQHAHRGRQHHPAGTGTVEEGQGLFFRTGQYRELREAGGIPGKGIRTPDKRRKDH